MFLKANSFDDGGKVFTNKLIKWRFLFNYEQKNRTTQILLILMRTEGHYSFTHFLYIYRNRRHITQQCVNI